MKKRYKNVKVSIEEPQDVVTTSAEVETGLIPFPSVTVEDVNQDPANTACYNL